MRHVNIWTNLEHLEFGYSRIISRTYRYSHLQGWIYRIQNANLQRQVSMMIFPLLERRLSNPKIVGTDGQHLAGRILSRGTYLGLTGYVCKEHQQHWPQKKLRMMYGLNIFFASVPPKLFWITICLWILKQKLTKIVTSIYLFVQKFDKFSPNSCESKRFGRFSFGCWGIMIKFSVCNSHFSLFRRFELLRLGVEVTLLCFHSLDCLKLVFVSI